jgi:RHS repeat-associated protein
MEYDYGSNLNHTLARQHSPTQGRWMTPDPAGLAAVDPTNPQTWNRYAYVRNNPVSRIDPTGTVDINPGMMYAMMSGGGGMDCNMDGVSTPCSMVYSAIQGGGAVQCPNNNCSAQYIGGQWQNFGAWADGSSGYMPGSLAGFSTRDAANALAMVTAAKPKLGTPVDPASLTGGALNAWNLLKALVAPGDITIYQNDGGDFEAVLSAQGFSTLMAGLDSNAGDAFLHYPYTDGARDFLSTNSLHAVWFDPNLTDYVGGSGVYMQFHTDANNPWQGFWNFLAHMGCVFGISGC